MEQLFGDALLSSFFDAICERLVSNDFIDYFRKGKLEKLVEKLQSTLNSINHVLDDAEEKQYKSQDVKNWLGDVKHAAYEADQLLDEIDKDAPLKKLKAESKNILFGFISSFTNPFDSRIKELLNNLDLLAEQKDMLGLKHKICARHKVGISPKPLEGLPTVSLAESDIYGREGDKNKLINLLVKEDNGSDNQVPVISIVGLGGIGKTTLAKLVYNDHEIKEKFDLKAWVYVSETYDVVRLTKAILRSFKFSAEGEDLNLLQLQLQQRLTGKKYLLVLDDVWNGNWKSWEQVLLPFNHGSSRSKIVVTTRDKEVASVLKSTQLHHLKKLEENECWNLFTRHAFLGRNVNHYPSLESIGKKIVVKCGGLPIAVKALANLLRRKFSQSEWVKILETDIWCLLDGYENINSVLRLSYHNLPSNLKRCFAYCSIFPKGYEFRKDHLIKLWMGEGLLKCCRTEKSEEELGNEFFNDLETISFFEPSLNAMIDKNYRFVMHDLVNDLAKSVSREFCLRIEGDMMKDIPERTRHIWCSLSLEDVDRKLERICKITGLRNLIVAQGYGYLDIRICSNVQHDMFSRLKYLRTLSFFDCKLTELVDEVSNLQLLRYLNLSCTGITRLPGSICSLYNLETLLLKGCKLSELPSDFYKLVNLRHLDLEDTDIKKMPKHIGRIKHLKMLTHFVVGDQSGSDIKELATLNHLQGTLHISGLENVIDPADATTSNLKDKKYLEELYMKYSIINVGGSGVINGSFVLEALQPNNNLHWLAIDNYCGKRFPSWLGGYHLPTLVSLNLRGCKFCTRFPPLGELPSLKELFIWGCEGIEVIGEEFYSNNKNSSNVAFRSLEILQFVQMSEWKEWVCLEGSFPLLEELSITFCDNLKGALPQHLPSLLKLEILSCQELEVSIPMGDNMSELDLKLCDKVLVNELPSRLKRIILGKSHILDSFTSLLQNILNSSILEELRLEVYEFVDCSSFDLQCCNSFRTLSIRGWHSSSLPFALDLFTNLHSLYLYNCPQLESFPGEGLPSSLNNLGIFNCPKLVNSREEWGLFKLNSLKSFIVTDGFENVESFPEEGLLPTALECLILKNCSKLRVINYRGLLHLKSLQYLHIHDCPCLEQLPEDGLPNSLSTLEITGCSLLKQRYQKDGGGEHWHKICHIRYVIITHSF